MLKFEQRTGIANPFDGVDIEDFSAPEFVDVDQDGDRDLVLTGSRLSPLGGLLTRRTRIFTYENNAGVWTKLSSAENPFGPIADQLGDRPHLHFGDLDLDGNLDFIFTKVLGFESVNGDVGSRIRYYKTNEDPSPDAPAFILQAEADNPFTAFNDELKNAGGDIGKFISGLAIADINNDGRDDVVFGVTDEPNFRVFIHNGLDSNGRIQLIDSTNTAANPLRAIAINGTKDPAFADLDNDGDLDLTIGLEDGTIQYYENVNGQFQARTGMDNPFAGIDLGDNATVAFVSRTNNRNLDAVFGKRDGKLVYFENVSDLPPLEPDPELPSEPDPPIPPSTPPINGTPQNDVLRGTSEDDTISGFDGDDRLNGKKGNDLLDGGNGSDRLKGSSGNDILLGGRGDDQLLGGRGDDDLNGGKGSDQFLGGAGDDIIRTGRGKDVVVLKRNHGFDRIEDFDLRRDRFDLRGNLRFKQLTIVQRGDNALIRIDSDKIAIVEAVEATALTHESLFF